MGESAHYSMVIRWSERDQAYLVALPEWEGRLGNWDSAAHGEAYGEAAENGRAVLEMLVAHTLESGEPLPEPQVFASV